MAQESECEALLGCNIAEQAPSGPVIAGGAVGCGILCLAVGAILSLGAVPPLHYGIRYNSASKIADVENVYRPGRHFIGPWSSFLLFPAMVQNIEFSNKTAFPAAGVRYPALHTRTKEGLALDLEVSLQYVLQGDRVGLLYSEFNLEYQEMFISTMRDTLIKAAAGYEAYQLWDQRLEVGNKMQKMVDDILNKTYADCWGLQLLDISLPTAFDASIIQTQVQSQMITTEQFAQFSTNIRATTAVIESDFARQAKVIKAGGEANYTLVTKTAKAEARQMVLDTEAEVLQNIKDQLELSQEDMVEYQKYTAVKLMANASLYYGFSKDSQVLLQPPRRLQGQGQLKSGDDMGRQEL